MRIRNQLVLMAAAVLVPIVLAAALAIDKIKEGERDTSLRSLGVTAKATALIVDREVQGALSGMKVLGHSPSLDQRDFISFRREAMALDQQPMVWTVLLAPDGTQLVNTRLPAGGNLVPTQLPVDLSEVLANGTPVVSGLFLGAQSGRMLTNIYVPAGAAGGKAFVVAQAFPVEFWIAKTLQQDLPPDWIVAVVDRSGKIIVRNVKPAQWVGQPARPEIMSAAARADDGLIRVASREGVETYAAFTHSSLTGWTVIVAAPVASVEAAATQAVRLALSGMLLAAAAAAIVAAAFGRSFIRAIEGASRAAVALGRGERPVVEKSGVDEVNQLNQSLVDAGLLLDIERMSRQQAEAGREQLLASETQAREAAQAQNVAKDQFLAMLGHELRNPLAAITGALALLGTEGDDRDRLQRCIDIIRRQNGHLGHIVNDLLDVSRLMAGKIMLELEPLNVAVSVRSCVEALRNTDRAAGYSIAVQAGDVWVSGDGVRLEQILNNLLTNALKFSPPGSEIRVVVRHEVAPEGPGRAVITVTDPGSGIAAELLESVFEPFVQGPPPANRMQSGMGIGLALVRQLVELHGGQVHARSMGPGTGSTFEFWLPAAQAMQAAPDATGYQAQPGRKIVYVEDNNDARATMGELLRAFGYDVVEVDNGKGVLDAVAAARPDAVLMDIGLPDMDGYEVARGLRADPRCRLVPLIALTGYGQLRDKEAAAQAGFNAHLIKPVDIQLMIRTIEGVMGPQPLPA
ncbi:MAG: response regulator [Burkholderiaceae bacterium]|nr:response regulator [Burkholderiaceae bacterium]